MANNQSPVRLLIIADIQTEYDQAENPFFEEGIELLEIINNAEDGVSRAIELKPDCILIDYYLPRNNSESGNITFYVRQESCGRILSFAEYLRTGYVPWDDNLQPWHDNFIVACEKIFQQAPFSRMIVMCSSSSLSDEFRQLSASGKIAAIIPRPTLMSEVIETISRVQHDGG